MHVRTLLATLLALACTAAAGRAQEPGSLPPLPADTAVFELGPIDVSVDRPVERGKLAGFYRRMRRGAGQFITREQIEERHPDRLTDLVHLVAGFETVRYADGSGRTHTVMGRAQLMENLGRCRIHYWLDGHPLQPSTRFDLDLVPPGDVVGIEVYRGVSETPARFRRRGAVCGVVVIWTRDPSSR